MKVLVVCVNYNSYDSLKKYLLSMDTALEKVKNLNIYVYIADNSSNKEPFDDVFKNFTYNLILLPNLGYFGGAFKIINTLNACDYHYTIISNVDVEFDKNVFIELLNIQLDKNAAWIAPQIFSNLENKDKNPQRLKRCSKTRLKFLLFMFKYPFLLNFYKKTFYNRKRVSDKHVSEKEIYCGHGSVIILTSSFFHAIKNVEYPVFLYGEEIFLGELIYKNNLKTIYFPQIKFYDEEHVSTKHLGKKYYEYNLLALKYLISEFYS